MNPANIKAAVVHYLAWLVVLGAIAGGVASMRAQTKVIEQIAQPTFYIPEATPTQPRPLVPRVYPGMAMTASWANSISNAAENLDERLKRLEAAHCKQEAP